MPAKKQQHYVPQRYLRAFAIPGEGNAISLYNVLSKKYVPQAGIKDQAVKAYFHGRDPKDEDFITSIEVPLGNLLDDIRNRGALPTDKESFTNLHLLGVIQHLRTLYMRDQYNETMEKLSSIFGDHGAEFKQIVEQSRLAKEDIPLNLILTAGLHLPLFLDTHIKLLEAPQTTFFVTSDHSVVFYNSYMENRNYPIGNIALASKGLQVFFPITPKLCLYYFDPAVYKVGTRKQSLTVISSKDVRNLNALQVACCVENLFFNEKVTKEQINAFFSYGFKFRPGSKAQVQEMAIPGRDISEQSLIYNTRPEIRMGLSLSFTTLTRSARQHKFDDYLAQVRNRETCCRHEQFLNDVFPARQSAGFMRRIDPLFVKRSVLSQNLTRLS